MSTKYTVNSSEEKEDTLTNVNSTKDTNVESLDSSLKDENDVEKKKENRPKKTPEEKNVIFSKTINILNIIILSIVLIAFIFALYKGVGLSTQVADKLMVGNNSDDKTNSVIEELVEQDVQEENATV